MSAKVLTNLESVGDMIGALKGISDGLDEEQYTAGLIRSAHGEATNLFDVMAASQAAAGHLEHVFEYDPRGGVRASPDKASRLWTHTIVGHGGRQDIGFLFRPAKQPNPRPTTESTGVASKYLAKLSNRKYIFWNKALVMETGRTVTIRPKNGNFLFVPFYGRPARSNYNSKNYHTDRGYMMYRGPITATPGGKHVGRFAATWMAWWGTEGAEFMEQHMRQTIERDTTAAEAQMAKRAAKMLKTPVATNIPVAAAKERRWMKNWFGAGTKRNANRGSKE